MRNTEFHYKGEELELFREAKNWKNYLSRTFRPHVKGDVIEVGAGIGATTEHLLESIHNFHSWTCLEPDGGNVAKLRQIPFRASAKVTVLEGTLGGLPADKQFDTILYVDVLEHIENDLGEIQAAAAHLRPGGKVVVLAPAHQRLFSEFDTAVGHYRRYDKASLSAVLRHSLKLEELKYLDSVGLLASSLNAMVLSQSTPKPWQIRLWDGVFVRASLLLDPLTLNLMGKSVFATAVKPL